MIKRPTHPTLIAWIEALAIMALAFVWLWAASGGEN